MKVEQVMTKDVYTVRVIDALDRAVELMREHDIGSLPVVDERGHVVGMLTDRDICMATYTHDLPPRGISVELVMSPRPVTCAPLDDLAVVEQDMRRRQVHRVPVVDDDGHPVGILSIDDLARAAHRGALNPVEVAETLAAVSAPHPLA